MKMTFLPGDKICEFEGSPSILELAIANGAPLNHSCGGMGSCTTCLVQIISTPRPLNARTDLEVEHAEARGFADFERLACQTLAVDGLVVEIPAGEPL